jgi:sulfate adenylyltransferase subunit 1 (EFTu-like GTPase family)
MCVRPNQDFRGFAGQIQSGIVRVGDRITSWPSGNTATVTRIVTFDGDLAMAFAPMSVTLTLDHEIDSSRGDVFTVEPAFVGQKFEAEVVWMDERPLDPGRVYLLKQGTRTVTAEINHPLMLNQIGNVEVSTARPLVFDRYTDNRGTGSFILIDPATQFTCGAGMITEPGREGVSPVAAPMSAAERIARLARHAGSDEDAIAAVRQALEEMLS